VLRSAAAGTASPLVGLMLTTAASDPLDVYRKGSHDRNREHESKRGRDLDPDPDPDPGSRPYDPIPVPSPLRAREAIPPCLRYPPCRPTPSFTAAATSAS